MKARLWNIRRSLVSPIALALIAQLIGCGAQKELLVQNLRLQLLGERLAEIYGQAAATVPVNVSKVEFVRRMKIAVTKMKAIDEHLNFQSDQPMERSFNHGDGSTGITAVLRLKKDDKSVVVLVHWTPKGEFYDLSVIPSSGTSPGCGVYSVAYQTTTAPTNETAPCP